MTAQNYTATFTVAQSPEQVFAAVTNPRGWWSEEIVGATDTPGAEFQYHYRDMHRARIRITALVPGKKVVWHVVENYFNFVADHTEWTGTDVVFEIGNRGDQTELRFTHVGLVPAYECYTVCADAWGGYVKGSLRDLITTGKGHPNPSEPQGYTTSFTVDQSPEAVFAAVTNPRAWWSEEIEGRTDALGAAFKFHYKDLHKTTQKITALVPNQRVVWEVTESHIGFVADTNEWLGTKIVFEIARKGARTELRFTHVGLVPAIECYDDCSGAWGFYVNDSLRGLITTGSGNPNRKQQDP